MLLIRVQFMSGAMKANWGSEILRMCIVHDTRPTIDVDENARNQKLVNGRS